MLLFKNTEKIGVLSSLFENQDYGIERLGESLSQLMDLRVFKSFISVKSKGYSFQELFPVLFMLPMLNCSSIFAIDRSGAAAYLSAGKDAYYDLLNHSNLKWRSLLYSFTKLFCRKVACSGNRISSKPSALIIDDTTIEKTGKKIEGISTVHDHTSNSYVLGYKLLLLAFFDGISTVPLDLSLHSEKRLSKKGFKKVRSWFQEGAKRKAELGSKKTDNAIKMIRRAVKHGFSASYVLVDSWFVNHELIKCVRSVAKGTMHLVGMVKQDSRKYTYKGREYTAKGLIGMLRHNVQYNRQLKLSYFKIRCEYKGTPVNLFCTRIGKQKSFKVLISTDTKLSMARVFEIYQIRWSIEVLFKDAKQYLYLGHCQSNDFDAQLASVTLAMIRYTALSVSLRFEKHETIGALFKDVSEQTVELCVVEKIWEAVKRLVMKLAELIGADWELIIRAISTDNQELVQLFSLNQNSNNQPNQKE